MNSMFYDARKFNGNLSKWRSCVTSLNLNDKCDTGCILDGAIEYKFNKHSIFLHNQFLKKRA